MCCEHTHAFNSDNHNRNHSQHRIASLQMLGLPQEVMSQVESKLVPPRPKKVSSEKALSLAKAKLDRVLTQKAKLNRAKAHHTAKLRECEDLLSTKMVELAEVEVEYRAASNNRFSPTQSVAVSIEPHSDPESETDNMSQDGAPADDDAPGDGMEHDAPEAEPQAGRPLAGPSVELFERSIATHSSVEMTLFKGIVDLRIESLNGEANNAAHWNPVQEDDEREAMRLTSWVILSVLSAPSVFAASLAALSAAGVCTATGVGGWWCVGWCIAWGEGEREGGSR